MKKMGGAIALLLVIFCMVWGCSGTEPVQPTEEKESPVQETEGGQKQETETEGQTQEETKEFQYREMDADSLFKEEELRSGGNLTEQYYAEKGEQLICVSYDPEESPFLYAYGEYTPQYGEGNVLILDVQLKGREGPLAIVLVRQSPEGDWEIKEEKQ